MVCRMQSETIKKTKYNVTTPMIERSVFTRIYICISDGDVCHFTFIEQISILMSKMLIFY